MQSGKLGAMLLGIAAAVLTQVPLQAQGDTTRKDKNRQEQATLTPTDVQFLATVRHANKNEVELAKLAKDKSDSRAVKSFADRLQKDHKKLVDQIEDIADKHDVDLPDDPMKMSREGYQPPGWYDRRRDTTMRDTMFRRDTLFRDTTFRRDTLPPPPTPPGMRLGATDQEHPDSLKARLERLEGPAFDDAFAAAMVKNHEKGIAMFQEKRNLVQNAEIRMLIDRTLPTLREHLATAQRLASGRVGASEPLR